MMKKTFSLAASLLLALSACSTKTTTTVEPELTPAESLQLRLDTLRQHGYMYAHQDDPFYGITWQWEKDRSDTRELVGDYPAIMGFDLGGIEMGDAKNLDSVPFTWIREEAIRQVERGGMITFSWHPRNPRTGGNAWDVSDTTVVRNILPGGEQYEKFCGWMNNVKDFLSSLVDKEGNPVPFIMRPWHEYNGSWFWWGQKLCSDEEYRGLWNMFQDSLNAAMPTNIVWSFSPNLQGNWTEEEFVKRYPGNDRVYLIGEDAYQWGSEEDFTAALTADLTFLHAFAEKNGKPIALTECGKQNSPTADWYTRVFRPVIDQFPICYFLTWRNWPAEHFGASKDAATADDFKSWYDEGGFMILKDIK